MGRTILGMVVGLVTMWLTVAALEFLGHAIFPPPAGLDPQNPEHLQMIIAAAPTGALAMLVVAWAGGSFTGGWVAARIARHARAAAIAVALFVIAGVAGMIRRSAILATFCPLCWWRCCPANPCVTPPCTRQT